MATPSFDLRTSADAFLRTGGELHEVLHAGRIAPQTSAELGQLAADSVAVARMIADLHPNLVEFWREREAQEGKRLALHGPFAGALADPPIGPMIALVKSLLMFLRAYQDAMYGLLFEITVGHRPRNMRMQEAIKKPTSSVGQVIGEHLDIYPVWFSHFRDLRNEVKTGVRFALLEPPEDVGLTFTTPTAGGGLMIFDASRPVVRISYLAHAFDMSTALARVACDCAVR